MVDAFNAAEGGKHERQVVAFQNALHKVNGVDPHN